MQYTHDYSECIRQVIELLNLCDISFITFNFYLGKNHIYSTQFLSMLQNIHIQS